MRIRIVFRKTESMRYTSHLDLHRAWERSIRRADLPLEYSKGFHPQPKINLASALPLGITSEHELVDIWLKTKLEKSYIEDRLISALPPGIEIISLDEITDSYPTLQSTLISAIYHVTLIDEIKDLEMRINALKKAKVLIRERRGKTYDLRPLIEKVNILQDESINRQVIMLQLAAREGATGRPDEVIDACSIDPVSVQIRRVRLLFNSS
jgi:radical SAM-linked protein